MEMRRPDSPESVAGVLARLVVPRMSLREGYVCLSMLCTARARGSQRPRHVPALRVDAIAFTPARKDALRREQRRRSFGLRREDRLLLYVGRLSADKCVDALIDALRDPRLERVHMVLAGDGPLRPALEAEGAAACPGRIHFVGTVRDHAALADLMSDADVFVHPGPRG